MMHQVRGDRVRIFDCDPDLLSGVDERAAWQLRHGVSTRCVHVEAGPWRFELQPGDTLGHLGLLVVNGLLAQTVSLADRGASELVGPGDLLRPWDADDAGGSVARESEWRALEPVSLAVLDRRFAAIVVRWPTITVQLLARLGRRCDGLVHQATVARVRHADIRLLLAFWQLADRWGLVTREGTVVLVPLTHQLLATNHRLEAADGQQRRLTARARRRRLAPSRRTLGATRHAANTQGRRVGGSRRRA